MLEAGRICPTSWWSSAPPCRVIAERQAPLPPCTSKPLSLICRHVTNVQFVQVQACMALFETGFILSAPTCAAAGRPGARPAGNGATPAGMIHGLRRNLIHLNFFNCRPQGRRSTRRESARWKCSRWASSSTVQCSTHTRRLHRIRTRGPDWHSAGMGSHGIASAPLQHSLS